MVTNKTAIGRLGTGFTVTDGVISVAGTGLDITGLTEESSIATGDMIPIYDVSATANRKMTRANLIAGLATIDAPTFTGIPAAPTAAPNTNTTQLATTAFVLAQAAENAPNPDSGSGAVGTATKFAREDHVHPLAGGGLSWSVITASQNAAADNGYVCNLGTLLTITLPTSIAAGKTIRVTGMGIGGWKIAQGAGQQIFFGDQNTTAGATGYIASVYYRDAIEIICIVANTTFQVVSAVGTVDVI